MVKKTSTKKNFHAISMVKPLKKEFSIILRKLSYTVLLLSTLFLVQCGTSDALDSIEANAVLNKITLNNEQVNEKNLNNELSLYLGEKLVFNIPHATELFDADQNDNTQIKAKITNQEDKTLVTFVIEGNTLTIDPKKIGTGTFTLAYTTSYNNLGIIINNKVKKIISDSFTKKINYEIIQNLNIITVPEGFPKTISVTQHVEKKITLPAVLDRFRKLLLPEISPIENAPKLNLLGNLFSITSSTIGHKTITLKYKTLEKIHTDDRLYTSTTQTLNIIIITYAQTNTITIPANISTTFTVTQNVAKTLILPTVTDSFNTEIVPTVNDPVATLNGNALIITSPTIGTKTITLAYTSQAINGKAATIQTVNITLTTLAPPPNTISFPANFTSTFTVTKNVEKTLTLPTVTDSFNTEIVPTVNDPVATLNGNSLIINSPTIGIKTITLTYRSQAINGKLAATNNAFILLTTVPKNTLKNKLTIVEDNGLPVSLQSLPNKGQYALYTTVSPKIEDSVLNLTVHDLDNQEVIPTFSFNSNRFSISNVKDGDKHKLDFQYLGGTGDELVIVDIIWTSLPKTINGIRYNLSDTYINTIRVRLTDKVSKKFTIPNDIKYYLGGVRKSLADRDGEVIKIDLEVRSSKNIGSLPLMQPLKGAFIVPTRTPSNESIGGLNSLYSNSFCTFCSPLGININLGFSKGGGVIKIVYKSTQVNWNYSDIDGDGVFDYTIYTPVTVTLYIEVNGAKLEDATFPSSN